MKTFSQFIEESESRMGRLLSPRGPSSTRGFMNRNRIYNDYSNTPPIQQRTRRRAILRKAGLPKGSANLKSPETQTFEGDGTKTKIKTHKHPGHFANERLRTMQTYDVPKNMQTRTVRSIARHLGKNSKKPVSDVDIYATTAKSTSKMTAGRNFNRAVKDVPKNVKSAGGKSFVGVPTDMNTGRKSPSRERKYRKDLRMSKQDPITNYQFKR